MTKIGRKVTSKDIFCYTFLLHTSRFCYTLFSSFGHIIAQNEEKNQGIMRLRPHFFCALWRENSSASRACAPSFLIVQQFCNRKMRKYAKKVNIYLLIWFRCTTFVTENCVNTQKK